MNFHHVRNIAILLLGFLLSSCVSSSKPNNEVDFIEISGIQQLVGCYTNKAENEGSIYPRYLSAIIWPDPSKENIHSKINVVRVELVSNHTLKLTGESKGSILKERIVIEGTDFKIESGRIVLKSTLIGPEDVFIGVGYESSTLGLDKHGNGKLRNSGVFVGTAFIVIPLAAANSDSFRFNKVSSSCETKFINELPTTTAK